MCKNIFIAITFVLAATALISCGGDDGKSKKKEKSSREWSDVDLSYDRYSSVESSADEEEPVEEDLTVSGIDVTPKTTNVEGEFSSCFEVVDGTYTLVLDDPSALGSDVLNVKLRRTSGKLPLRPGERIDRVGYSDGMSVHLSVDLFDASGKKVGSIACLGSDDTADLAEASSGTEKELSFIVSKQKYESQPATFVVKSSASHFKDGKPDF